MFGIGSKEIRHGILAVLLTSVSLSVLLFVISLLVTNNLVTSLEQPPQIDTSTLKVQLKKQADLIAELEERTLYDEEKRLEMWPYIYELKVAVAEKCPVCACTPVTNEKIVEHTVEIQVAVPVTVTEVTMLQELAGVRPGITEDVLLVVFRASGAIDQIFLWKGLFPLDTDEVAMAEYNECLENVGIIGRSATFLDPDDQEVIDLLENIGVRWQEATILNP
jgi:hypothetical protein